VRGSRQSCARYAKPEGGAQLVDASLREPSGEEATNARHVVALCAGDKFGNAQARSLGGSEPHQLLTYPATTKLATNVDGDASPFAIDLDVDEPDALVVQEANPSVPNRSLLNTDDAGGPTATEWSFFGRPSGRSSGRSG